MKYWGAFAITLVLLAAALVTSEKQRVPTPVSPDAVLSLIADSEHELTRLPVSFDRMSDEEEIDIGNRLAEVYLNQENDANVDPETREVRAYVNRVGARVARGAHRRLPYRFHYLSSPDFINAFALPGGHVVIGGGLMALMDSEDELASVLGHEVEHIDHYHCQERVQTQAALHKVPLGEMVAIPIVIFQAGYSKNQELEADREGTRLAVQAGYSPLGAIRMFQTFGRLFEMTRRRSRSPQEELSKLAIDTLNGYFRSHPLPSERIAQIKQMISDEHWESKVAEQPLEVEYVFQTERAQRALAAGRYAEAESAATRSLSLRPEQIDALATLTSAQFALMELPSCKENYRKLLAQSPPDAGNVGVFALQIAQEALNARHFEQAAKYAGTLLDFQPNNAEGLAALAEAQVGKGDFQAAEATWRTLENLYPPQAQEVVNYVASAAQNALEIHHYAQARDVAGFWLTLRPRVWDALKIQASASLALGDFAAAAQADRGALDAMPRNSVAMMELVWNYADALSASKRGQAAVEDFRRFMTGPRPETTSTIERQIRIEDAGLALMAGDEGPAKELAADSRRPGRNRISPELLNRLGWWYYRAGKYSYANVMLYQLVMLRPGDVPLRNDLAWVEMEDNQLDDATTAFSEMPGTGETHFEQWNSAQMGLAIALWRARKTDDALKQFEPAVNAEPRWTNSNLVRAFYSPGVAQTVDEMKSEQARRLQARKR